MSRVSFLNLLQTKKSPRKTQAKQQVLKEGKNFQGTNMSTGELTTASVYTVDKNLALAQKTNAIL